MIFTLKLIFTISAFIIFWAMIGYPISLKIIKKIVKPRKIKIDLNYHPTVTLMIVAHNEEKVIKDKLENSLQMDYDKNKLEILVASDNSDDNTNRIVEKFIKDNGSFNIRLHKTKNRKGKTNAQNEAVQTIKSEIIVMTDANSIFEKNAIKELVSFLNDRDVAYVTGKLCYSNSKNKVGKSESTYWNIDLSMREIESNLQTITAGNGAIYACRRKDYHVFKPIQCHDSAMPVYYALKGKRAVFNKNAIAYEKAGEKVKDEFKRKVRMSRIILNVILPDIRILNIFKYKWFTYFYLGHRTCRYLLWIMHILLFITSTLLIKENIMFLIIFCLQILFYLCALIDHFSRKKIKIFEMQYYYCMTIIAQMVGAYNIITGKAKPFWEKAESTR